MTETEAGTQLLARRLKLNMTIKNVIDYFKEKKIKMSVVEISRIECGFWGKYDDLTACMLNDLYNEKESEKKNEVV